MRDRDNSGGEQDEIRTLDLREVDQREKQFGRFLCKLNLEAPGKIFFAKISYSNKSALRLNAFLIQSNLLKPVLPQAAQLDIFFNFHVIS